ncbi:MAG: hypothetical protein K6T74_14830 [Geminicoccaceae bacterium]|nr:hypothetical protein [Geminicoccaceae bacterium]
MSTVAPAGATPPRRSPAQSEAARRNGARSRGPVTAEGKARASRNALRHGLCSTRSLAPGEDAAAFAALRADLLDEAAPRSRLEALLLERLALTFWKLARCDRLEATLATIEPHCPAGRLFPDPGLPRILSRIPELSLLVRYQGQLGRDLQRLVKLVGDPLLDRLARTAHDAPAEEGAPAPAEAAEPAAAANPPAALRNEPEPARPSGATAGPGLEAELRCAARDDPALAAALLEGLLAKGDLAGFTALARELREIGPAAADPPTGSAPREPALGPRAAAAPAPAASRNEPEPAPPRPANPTAAPPSPLPTGPRDGGTAPPEPPMRNEPEPSLAAIGPSPRGEPGRASDGWPPAPAAFPPRTDTARAAAGPATPASRLARAEPPPTPDRLADLRGQLPWAR